MFAWHVLVSAYRRYRRRSHTLINAGITAFMSNSGRAAFGVLGFGVSSFVISHSQREPFLHFAFSFCILVATAENGGAEFAQSFELSAKSVEGWSGTWEV